MGLVSLVALTLHCAGASDPLGKVEADASTVKKVSIANTATGKASDVTFATGTNDGVYSLGWVPLCVTLAAADQSGVAEYTLTIQWTNGRRYDKCRVLVTMKGQNQEATYTLASIVDDDGALGMGLGRRRDLPTTLES